MPDAAAATANEPMLRVADLKRQFDVSPSLLNRVLAGTGRALVHAVDGVSFAIRRGETFSLVGESGCGKSTLAKILTGLETITKGNIHFKKSNSNIYGRQIQMVFQDPFSSLNPSLTGGEAIMEPLLVHNIAKKTEAKQKALKLLELTGLSEEFFTKYPHQMSGGQRQSGRGVS